LAKTRKCRHSASPTKRKNIF